MFAGVPLSVELLMAYTVIIGKGPEFEILT